MNNLNNNRYNHLNDYLKSKFGERTLKICINGNFTCPNRDGLKGIGGCIFCSEKGSGDHLHVDSIQNQINNFFNSYRAQRANKFIVYFQNYTNTYDTIENLKIKYDSALIDERIIGLSIATRPDCINEEIAKLLYSYTHKYYVSVELGLQTANEQIGQFINRCYTNDDFSRAVNILNKYGIDVIAHIIIGLPHENENDIDYTVRFLNKHNIQGLKIHSCYIVKNTKLENLYLENIYIPIDLDSYLAKCSYVLTHIKPNIIIHRVSGDAPKDLLIAPDWNLHKKWIINGLDKLMREKNLWQGMYYKS